MWRKLIPIWVLFVVLASVAGLVTAVHQSAAAAPVRGGEMVAKMAGVRTTAVCTGTNLLENPGFEGDYTVYHFPPPGHPDCQTWDPNEPNQYCERAKMPAGWHPRWLPDGTEEWIIMPEYVPSTPDQVNPDRVRSGEKSLHYFSFFQRHESAVHQQVTAVPGAIYCFSAWGHAWSATTSTDFYSDPDPNNGDLFQKVGIDPTGGTDWQADTVIWSEARHQYDYFGEFVVTATAEAPTVTVFIWSRTERPAKHNDVYWDDALLVLSETIPSLAVWPGQMAVMATLTQPVTMTQPIHINLTEGFTWTAALSLTGGMTPTGSVMPIGGLTPTLSAVSGVAGENLTVTLSTQGLVTGTYTATLMIDAGPEVMGSPVTIPVTVYVVSRLENAYLPVIMRP